MAERATDALLRLNPQLAKDLATCPHHVCLILLSFYKYKWLLSWRSAEARAAWRALPGHVRDLCRSLMSEVAALRSEQSLSGLDLGDADTNTDLAWRIGRLFGAFLVLPVREWSAERNPSRSVSVIH